MYQGEAPRGAWVLNPNDNSYHAPPASSSTAVVAAPTPDTNEVPVAAVSHDKNRGSSEHDKKCGNAIVEDAGDVWNRLIAEEEAAKARAAATASAASSSDSTPPATTDERTASKHPEDASTSVNSSASASLPPPPSSTDSPATAPSSPSPTRSQDSPGITAARKLQPPSEGTFPVADGPTTTETLAALDEKLRVLSTTQAPAPAQPPATEHSDPKESTQKADTRAFVR